MREMMIKVVGNVRPSLFYYKADPDARQGIDVVVAGDAIDIVRGARREIIRIGRKNAVYLPDMINSFGYFFGSATAVKARVRGATYELVDFSTPRLHQVTGFDDFSLLCPSLTEPFMTCEQYLEFAELEAGDVAIDLGSYSALTSIAFSKAVGATGKVIALEPDPLNYYSAEVNIASHRRVNGLENIVLLPHAVSDKAGTLLLSSEGAMGSALISIVGKNRGEVTEVECLTLQDIVEDAGVDKVNFIKMDIEGAELSVVLGSREFLLKYRPRLIIEPHYVDGALTSVPIIAFLESIGYQCSVIEQSGLALPLITAAPSPLPN